MSNINVSYAEMERSAAQLASGRDEIAQKFQQLQSLVSELVASGFVTDQASGRFSASYTEYTTHAQAVVGRLTEMHDFLSQTANALREMDAQIAARIS